LSIPSATIEKNRFSTPDAFRRQVHMGVLWLLNETTNEHPDAKIKILIPTDEQIVKTIKEAKLESPQIDFGIYEHGLIIRITIVIVDKKECMIVESKDDTKDSSYNAAGLLRISVYMVH
jgi:two-component system, OmpR family, sensor histidine kinase VicK